MLSSYQAGSSTPELGLKHEQVQLGVCGLRVFRQTGLENPRWPKTKTAKFVSLGSKYWNERDRLTLALFFDQPDFLQEA